MAISDELRKQVDPNNESCCEHCLSNKCKEWALENEIKDENKLQLQEDLSEYNKMIRGGI